MDLMLDYLDWRDEYATSDYLFISKVSGQKINKDYPGSALVENRRRIGHTQHKWIPDEKFPPHCWRRFFTTQLHRAGMDPEYIKYLRGDVIEPEAWQIYNAIDPEDVRSEYLNKIPKLFAKNTTFHNRLE
jgi:integrase